MAAMLLAEMIVIILAEQDVRPDVKIVAAMVHANINVYLAVQALVIIPAQEDVHGVVDDGKGGLFVTLRDAKTSLFNLFV